MGDGGQIVQLDDESDCRGSELPPEFVSVGLSANTGNEAALGIGLVGEEIQPSGKKPVIRRPRIWILG